MDNEQISFTVVIDVLPVFSANAPQAMMAYATESMMNRDEVGDSESGEVLWSIKTATGLRQEMAISKRQ